MIVKQARKDNASQSGQEDDAKFLEFSKRAEDGPLEQVGFQKRFLKYLRVRMCIQVPTTDKQVRNTTKTDKTRCFLWAKTSKKI